MSSVRGVWLIDGGMHRSPGAGGAGREARRAIPLSRPEVGEILVRVAAPAASGWRMASDLAADAVVVNADVGAVAAAGSGPCAPRRHGDRRSCRSARSPPSPGVPRGADRRVPAARATTSSSRPTSRRVRRPFGRARLPTAPTVYVCAQDRGGRRAPPVGPERLLVLVNAPPKGDRELSMPRRWKSCAERTFGVLDRARPAGCAAAGATAGDDARGLRAACSRGRAARCTAGARTGGWPRSAGREPARGCRASISREAARIPVPGVPMAALSGRLAAASVLADLTLRTRPVARRTAMPGGMSMR